MAGRLRKVGDGSDEDMRVREGLRCPKLFNRKLKYLYLLDFNRRHCMD